MDPQVPFRFLPCNSSTFKSPKKRRKLRKANRCSGLAAPEGVAQGRRTGGAPGSGKVVYLGVCEAVRVSFAHFRVGL